MKPMITNGGPHPADKWADMTTETILDLVQVEEDSVSPEAAAARQAKRDLRPVLFGIFNAYHDAVQKHERDDLTKNVKTLDDANARAAAKIDVTPHLGVMDQVDAALAATPFATHFAKPEVSEIVHLIIAQHTANAMHIERSYHRDRQEAKGA